VKAEKRNTGCTGKPLSQIRQQNPQRTYRRAKRFGSKAFQSLRLTRQLYKKAPFERGFFYVRLKYFNREVE